MEAAYPAIGKFVLYLLIIVALAAVVTLVEFVLGIKYPSWWAQLIYKVVVIFWGVAIFKVGEFFFH